MAAHKLYCYVDESGQDTFAQKGRTKIFVVAVTVMQQNKDELENLCVQYEKASGKGKFKWGKADLQARLRYMSLIVADNRFDDVLRYAVWRDTKANFDDMTVEAISLALRIKRVERSFHALIYVDGLSKEKRREYTSNLRSNGVAVYQVRGVAKDESSPLTRLADALAGFVRDSIEGDLEAQVILKRAKQDHRIVQV